MRFFVSRLLLFAEIILAADTSSPGPPQSSAQVASQERPRKIYSGEELARLNFTHDPNNRLSVEERRAIKDPMKRARASSPNSFREIRTNRRRGKCWKATDQTNAEYVDHEMRRSRARTKQYLANRQRARHEGREQLAPSTRVHRRLRDQALSGRPDDVMMFKQRDGALVADPKGRTRAEYIEHTRKYNRELQAARRKRLRELRQEGRSPVAAAERKVLDIDLNKTPPSE